IEEILDIATQLMTEQGVNGLSLAEVARRLGVQPPSLYKYFPSLMAVYGSPDTRTGSARCPAATRPRSASGHAPTLQDGVYTWTTQTSPWAISSNS
ncbi:MAG: TetR/AcrR family transcriptional regulator, partial [Acidimicrobiales bacterium]